ncbi:MAG: hypothetical protein ACFFBI_10380 [Promethearchaeota archaeon]
MKKSKSLMILMITGLMVGIIGYAVAHPTEILAYEGASHTGCHGTAGAASSGTLTVTTSVSGRLITLTTSIQGFTDAIDNNRSGTFSIGIPYALGDNREFGLGITQNTVNGDTDYWGVGIWEVNLDGNGNTVNPLKFRVLAPETDGVYNLFLAVINAANTTGDAQSIIYFHKATLVTVASGSVTIASLAMVLPFQNALLYGAVGIIGCGAIYLIIKRKRK